MFNEALFVFTFYFAAITMIGAFVWSMYDMARNRRFWKQMDANREESI